MPDPTPERRTKLRLGFALCCAALALAAVALLGSLSAQLFASSTETDVFDARVRQIAWVLEIVFEAVFIPGLLCLYVASNGVRWRRTTTLLLAVAGVGLTIIGVQIAGSQPEVAALANRVGEALGWVGLWMVAVLAAEAAESLERPDITYQTEVVGRVVVWGGFVWLAWLIWTFQPSPGAEPSAKSERLDIAMLLKTAVAMLVVFAVVRTALCCCGLAVAYSTAGDQRPPAEPA